jgi:hypothetical protein
MGRETRTVVSEAMTKARALRAELIQAGLSPAEATKRAATLTAITSKNTSQTSGRPHRGARH